MGRFLRVWFWITVSSLLMSCPIRAQSGSASVRPRWTLIGPAGTKDLQRQTSYSGQIHSIAIDPRNPNTIYIGTRGGGIWKTDDGGLNWQPLTDTQPDLYIQSVALY